NSYLFFCNYSICMLPEESKISELMSHPVIVIDVNETIRDAAILLKTKNIHGLIVVNETDILGIITDKDIVFKVIAENLIPKETIVKDIMTHTLIFSNPDENIHDVSKKMYANNISRIPIIDLNEILVGIVTKTDIIKIYPAMIDIFTGKQYINEPVKSHERTLLDGRCEECGNAYDDLVDVCGLWLCRSCSEDKTVIGSKKLGL
ncbi:MAG: CBS domain-containing protein, partial [Candidatus Aenigmarchaeota archaeon]|nr:CBS domain-containing protein [Candidatus Aenigmarchaeota archaeon]